MSGLEPLVALGLACNTLQLVGTGRETIRTVRQIYQDGKLDPALNDRAGELKSLAERASTASDTTLGAGTAPTATASAPRTKARDKQLLGIAEQCVGAARDLQEEIAFLNTTKRTGKLAVSLEIAAKTAWRKRRLDRLDQKLNEIQRTLQTGLLTAIIDRSIQTNSDLSSLNSDIQAFTKQYRNDSLKAVHDLMQHTSIEARKSEVVVTTHLDHVAKKLDQSADGRLEAVLIRIEGQRDKGQGSVDKERLLRSFKFQGMNERRNHITDSYPKTCEWVLREGSEESSSSGDDGLADSWDSFPNWLRSTAHVYWISGRPGSGKSTLTRYLVAAEKTQAYLADWAQNTLIVSHFLWRPGTVLQQSIKGLLLSVLHQLFLSLECLGENAQIFTHKEHDTDWSVNELQQLLLCVLQENGRAVVLFLDGLDEVLPRDGVPQLLAFLGRVEEVARVTGKLKLCLASRPEPLLVRALGCHPHLRLEDLNRPDLEQYAREAIIIPSDYYIPVDKYVGIDQRYFVGKWPPSRATLAKQLTQMLVDRAEGIFLWLSLTVNTVLQALQLNESIEDIIHRIHQLPKGLSQLFADMWERNNGDSIYHKSRASFYLRLVLAVSDDKWIPMNRYQRPITQFNVMLASNPKLLDRLIDARSPDAIPVQELIEACRRNLDDVLARCAGLIKSVNSEYSSRYHLIEPRYDDQYRILHPVPKIPAYGLVHRSAHDFLLETEAGQSILSASTSSTMELILMLWKAELACTRLFNRTTANDNRSIHFTNSERQLEHQLSTFRIAMREIPADQVSDTLRAVYRRCETLFNNGCLAAEAERSIWCSDQKKPVYGTEITVLQKDAFLLETAFVAQSVSTWEYIMSLVEARSIGPKTLSQLFNYACIYPWYKGVGIGVKDLMHKLLPDLLSRNVRPAVATLTRRPSLKRDATWSTRIWLVRTPLMTLLTTAWERALSFYPAQENACELVSIVDLLVDHGADVGEDTYVTIWKNGYSVTFGSMLEQPESYQWPNSCFVVKFPAWALLTILHDRNRSRCTCQLGHTEPEDPARIAAYSKGQLFAIAQRSHADQPEDSRWFMAKANIHLQHHWQAFADELHGFTHLAIDALRKAPFNWALQEVRLELPSDINLRVNQAFMAMQGDTDTIKHRAREFRMMMGIETPIEDFVWNGGHWIGP